ncbi:hypothetical protein Ddye_024439 [Dipteronia dyeriana]|uniref:RNase H type-1 domain-containing protein n=1 Tax=Dipteronia dyeriana TaxID=168575 RepID=A0AAD9WTL3_9ROSI|nr:hypothetical protein Ddye_024439 [Dipteronia dyeriana]
MDDAVWKPSDVGCFKVNTDVAIDSTKKRVGIGIFVWDSSWAVVASSAQSILAGFNTQIAESIAILKELQLALETCFWNCIIESDAQVVVNLINSRLCVNLDVGLIYKDILSLLAKFQVCSVRYVPRRANMATHGLAKLGLSVNLEEVFMEEVPPCVALIVLGDCHKFDVFFFALMEYFSTKMPLIHSAMPPNIIF